jgi:hypothetical protein
MRMRLGGLTSPFSGAALATRPLQGLVRPQALLVQWGHAAWRTVKAATVYFFGNPVSRNTSQTCTRYST